MHDEISVTICRHSFLWVAWDWNMMEMYVLIHHAIYVASIAVSEVISDKAHWIMHRWNECTYILWIQILSSCSYHFQWWPGGAPKCNVLRTYIRTLNVRCVAFSFSTLFLSPLLQWWLSTDEAWSAIRAPGLVSIINIAIDARFHLEARGEMLSLWFHSPESLLLKGHQK